MANNNQPKVGRSGRLDVISERVGVGSTGGCMVQSFGAANKIHRGLRWPPIDAFVLNNQPKTVGRDGGDYGWETRRAGGAGGCDIIVFWRGEVN